MSLYRAKPQAFIRSNRFKASFRVILAVGIATLLFDTSLQAASLERIGDGRIEVKAYGQTAAFREKDADRINFYLLRGNCDPNDIYGSSLGRWLENPAIAACLDRVLPNGPAPWTGLTLRVQPVREGDLIFPGGVKAVGFPAQFTNSNLSIVAELGSGDLGAHCKETGVVKNPVRFGFQLIPAPSGQAHPNYDEYSLPSDRRLGKTSRPLCVVCSRGPVGDGCAVMLESADGLAALRYSWAVLTRPDLNRAG